MLLTLTDLSNEPLQAQIARQIRAKILSGELAANEGLPSIRALSREQHISVITVQRAYEHLEREGLIYSRRSRGFFVSELSGAAKKKMAVGKLKEYLRPVFDKAFDEGLTSEDARCIVESLLNEKK